ncbi:MAG: hypothetical protein C5S38_03105 [Candidatus Methanophagaceae archaeon]|nr:MAG: hypothetical protein C5S38_03105 [Methanophagales archaeon]
MVISAAAAKGKIEEDLVSLDINAKIVEQMRGDFVLADLNVGRDDLLDMRVEKTCIDDILKMLGRVEEGEIKLCDI